MLDDRVLSAVEEYQQYCGECSVLLRDTIQHCEGYKPLIFSRATFRERSVSHHRAMRNVVSSLFMQRSDREV